MFGEDLLITIYCIIIIVLVYALLQSVLGHLSIYVAKIAFIFVFCVKRAKFLRMFMEFLQKNVYTLYLFRKKSYLCGVYRKIALELKNATIQV